MKTLRIARLFLVAMCIFIFFPRTAISDNSHESIVTWEEERVTPEPVIAIGISTAAESLIEDVSTIIHSLKKTIQTGLNSTVQLSPDSASRNSSQSWRTPPIFPIFKSKPFTVGDEVFIAISPYMIGTYFLIVANPQSGISMTTFEGRESKCPSDRNCENTIPEESARIITAVISEAGNSALFTIFTDRTISPDQFDSITLDNRTFSRATLTELESFLKELQVFSTDSSLDYTRFDFEV